MVTIPRGNGVRVHVRMWTKQSTDGWATQQNAHVEGNGIGEEFQCDIRVFCVRLWFGKRPN